VCVVWWCEQDGLRYILAWAKREHSVDQLRIGPPMIVLWRGCWIWLPGPDGIEFCRERYGVEVSRLSQESAGGAC